MALPVAGLFAWLVGLFTSTFTTFATWLIGRMVYAKTVHYALVTAFVVAAAGLTAGIALTIKAAIFAAQVSLPNSLGMFTYFLPANVNVIFGLIVTIRVSHALYRWTVTTMRYYIPPSQVY